MAFSFGVGYCLLNVIVIMLQRKFLFGGGATLLTGAVAGSYFMNRDVRGLHGKEIDR